MIYFILFGSLIITIIACVLAIREFFKQEEI